MKVFIDNEAGKFIKNEYDEKTLGYIRSYKVGAAYPFPYGFFLNTTSGDGDNLDCFVITKQPIQRGEVVEVEPLGVMEVIDTEEIDHKIIARLKSEKDVAITESIRSQLTEFTLKVFSNIPEKHTRVGDFLSEEEALKLINQAIR